ncbi:unnamed protein product [Cyprideis torosa]|uniref:Uncharacterized protein n=1 Tax=Cyprideis torosa TaxID=163714 RepID=A0A7R8WIN3_9CRUS|nr:unnamed protein product [Cyprideis torosa]CAG0898134.1 unnamed protein product [Cyprideis torosa]
MTTPLRSPILQAKQIAIAVKFLVSVFEVFLLFFSSSGDGTFHMKLLVPAVVAGSIIGKGGETIAQLQRETNTRVKMSKANDMYPGTTERVCVISGNCEGIMSVLDFICERVREKPSEGLALKLAGTVDEKNITAEREKQVKILVPNTTAGMIIGKAGSFIKQIKEESGSFVQISQKAKDQTLSERCITVIGESSVAGVSHCPVDQQTALHSVGLMDLVGSWETRRQPGSGLMDLVGSWETRRQPGSGLMDLVGEADTNRKACGMILQKIIDDPQSGSCLNVSYAEFNGPVANFNPTGSPYAVTSSVTTPASSGPGVSVASASTAANLSSESLSFFGSPLMSNLPLLMEETPLCAPPAKRIKDAFLCYSNTLLSCRSRQMPLFLNFPPRVAPSSEELVHSSVVLGNFNSLFGALAATGGLNFTLILNPATGGMSLSCPTYSAQVLDQIRLTLRANGITDPVLGELMAAFSTFGNYGTVLMGGLNSGLANGGIEAATSTATTNGAAATGALASLADGAPGFGDMRFSEAAAVLRAQQGSGGSGGSSATPAANATFGLSATTLQQLAAMHDTKRNGSETSEKDVEVCENIIGAILGRGGKSLLEIQACSGATIQISRKGQFAPGTRNRIVSIHGSPESITAAQLLITQRIQEEENKRARQGGILLNCAPANAGGLVLQ